MANEEDGLGVPYKMISGKKIYYVKRRVGRNRFKWVLPSAYRKSRVAEAMEQMER